MFSCVYGQTAQNATYRDSVTWDIVTNTTYWSTAGYDIVWSTTNVTAAQLGYSNTIPTVAGVIAKVRPLGVTNNVVTLASFLPPNLVGSSYLAWVRTAAYPSGDTNVYVSDWTNIVVSWVNTPAVPGMLRIRSSGAGN